jgi:hypothetical protein
VSCIVGVIPKESFSGLPRAGGCGDGPGLISWPLAHPLSNATCGEADHCSTDKGHSGKGLVST